MNSIFARILTKIVTICNLKTWENGENQFSPNVLEACEAITCGIESDQPEEYSQTEIICFILTKNCHQNIAVLSKYIYKVSITSRVL